MEVGVESGLEAFDGGEGPNQRWWWDEEQLSGELAPSFAQTPGVLGASQVVLMAKNLQKT